MKSGAPRDVPVGALVVVVLGLATAAVAHGAAGGGTPGIGGWAVALLALLPVAFASARLLGDGPAGLAAAAFGGQGVAHVMLSVVSTPAAGGGHAGAHVGAHGAVHMAAHGAQGATVVPGPLPSGPLASGAGPATAPEGPGWSAVTAAAGHLLHMGPVMIAGHALAAVATALLVAAVREGLRRIAVGFVRLLRTLLAPATPFAPPAPRPVRVRPGPGWDVQVLPLRGPPVPA